MWECKCDCGETTIVQSGNLRSGHTKSCGCFEIENKQKVSERMVVKHGNTNTRLFHIWQSMLERCYCNGNGFKNYGERGISVCEEWRDFSNFKEWSLENGYVEDAPRGVCTIDRIDVNGNYEPSNCRWVANKVQQNNRRNNFMVTYNGKTQSLKLWTEELGLPYRTILARLRHGKWSVDEAFNTPIAPHRRCCC